MKLRVKQRSSGIQVYMDWKVRSCINEKRGSFPGSICEPAPCCVPLGKTPSAPSLGDSMALTLGAFLGRH